MSKPTRSLTHYMLSVCFSRGHYVFSTRSTKDRKCLQQKTTCGGFLAHLIQHCCRIPAATTIRRMLNRSWVSTSNRLRSRNFSSRAVSGQRRKPEVVENVVEVVTETRRRPKPERELSRKWRRTTTPCTARQVPPITWPWRHQRRPHPPADRPQVTWLWRHRCWLHPQADLPLASLALPAEH